MKILILCNEYPPFVHGGIGSFTRDLAEGLAREGHSVTVFGLYAGLIEDEATTTNGVSVIKKKYKKKFRRIDQILYMLAFNYKLRVFLKGRRFDIVECQEWQGLMPFGLGHPGHVIRLHGASIFFDKILRRKGSRLCHWLEARTIRKAKNLVAVSNYCGKSTLKFCGINRGYKVLYNAVNSEKIRGFSNEKRREFSIVFANSMLPKKGIFELAESFNIIADKFPQASLTFIGKTEYNENGEFVADLIARRVRPEFRERVSILGWLDSASDVYRHLGRAHVCVYPSKMEGFGIAPVEAMVLERPTIFMCNGPGPEVIEDQVSGVLVDSNSPVNIAQKIEEVFSGRYDLVKMGLEARDRVERLFDLKNVFIPRNIDFYRDVLEKDQ